MEILTQKTIHLGLALRLIGFSILLNIWFKESIPRSIGVAAIRTLLGIVVGLIYTFLALNLGRPLSYTPIFYVVFTALRYLEWALIVGKFYPELKMNRKGYKRFLAIATLLSVGFDLGAIMLL